MTQVTGGPHYRIKGLRELDRALGKCDKGLRKNVRSQFKGIADQVATKARSIADSKDLRDSGDLIASIKPFSLTGRSGVRATASHGGYAYPARIEYEGRAGGISGPRGFLNPAVEASKGDIERGIEHVLDELADDFYGGVNL